MAIRVAATVSSICGRTCARTVGIHSDLVSSEHFLVIPGHYKAPAGIEYNTSKVRTLS